MKKETVENKAAFLESLSVFSVPYRVADYFFMKKKWKKKTVENKAAFLESLSVFSVPYRVADYFFMKKKLK